MSYTSNYTGSQIDSAIALAGTSVQLSGDQTVEGTKTFSSPINGSVSGSSGSCTGNSNTVTNGVYLETDQTITGLKTFKTNSGGYNFRVFSQASSTNDAFWVYGSGFVNGVATGASGSAAMVYVNKDSGNLRSINAAGSLNASGADYAEYETKNDKCGVIEKGQIVGFDVNGLLTDKWSDAISFAVKTTNPSYVGGDTWGAEENIGAAPEELEEDASDESKHQFQLDLASWKERLEDARQKVDRVAYSGKVPCNVTDAKVGDYIIAVQNGDEISGEAVADPTFEQYKKAVGRVRRIIEDGRCEVSVIIH